MCEVNVQLIHVWKVLAIMAVLASTAESQALSDRFFDEYYFPLNPTTATYTGIHKYDAELEDYSKATIAVQVAQLKRFEAEFAKLPADSDRDLLLSNIRATLLNGRRFATGAQSRFLFQLDHEQRFYVNEPPIRAARRTSTVSDFARTQDAECARRSARESQKSATNLY